MTDCFIITYNSEGNMFKGTKVIVAKYAHQAQTIFFDWLKEQDVYRHLWNLELSIVESKIMNQC